MPSLLSNFQSCLYHNIRRITITIISSLVLILIFPHKIVGLNCPLHLPTKHHTNIQPLCYSNHFSLSKNSKFTTSCHTITERWQKNNAHNSYIKKQFKTPSTSTTTNLYVHTNNQDDHNIQNGIDTTDSNTNPILITEVDMRYNLQTPLTYDPTLNRYTNSKSKTQFSQIPKLSYFSHFFLPSSVTPSYYKYIRWRILQRYINAIVHVLGTQSLLMGLGFKSNKVGFASASLTWICKDALGKIARMIWASKMGHKFDSDAKRWRFRSSLVFAFGNGLEICAMAFPKWFLVWATLSNAMKQMCMLTSTSTRNALYNSFSVGGTGVNGGGALDEKGTKLDANENGTVRRESLSSSKSSKNYGVGGGENIGDITAKGEAQIAIVDLIGIASGIVLSKIIGIRIRNVLCAWLALQFCEIACMYKEIRSVVFSVLNFERLWSIVDKFVEMDLEGDEDYINLKSSIPTTTSTSNGQATVDQQLSNIQQRRKQRTTVSFYSDKEVFKRVLIPTPMQMANDEKIFLPPDSLARRSSCFGSFGRTKLNPTELQSVLDIFKGEKFLLIVGENIKKPNRGRNNMDPRENCHVILHKDATNMDIVKSTLAIGVLRRSLYKQYHEKNENDKFSSNTIPVMRTQDYLPLLQLSKVIADEWFLRFLKILQVRGWATPAKYMFGKVTIRADWPISESNGKRSKNTTLAKSSRHSNDSSEVVDANGEISSSSSISDETEKNITVAGALR